MLSNLSSGISPEIPVWVSTTLLSLWVIGGLLILVGIFLVAKSLSIPRSSKALVISAVSLTLVGWFAVVAVLGKEGVFRPDPRGGFRPVIPLMVLLSVIAGYNVVRLSSTARTILFATPQSWLIGIQFFRIAGAFFIALYLLGFLPGTFAIPAGVGDVVVGLSAIPIALSHQQRRWWLRLAKGWNYFGIFDLLSVGVLAVTSSSTALLNFPLVMIPMLRVPLAYILHLYSLKVLRAQDLYQRNLGNARANNLSY